MTSQQFERFSLLRLRLFQQIKAVLEIDDHCKSFEGKLSIHWPNYFDEKVQSYEDSYSIEL